MSQARTRTTSILFGLFLAAGISAGAAEPLPANVLDLSRWRLTLPVDSDRPGEPDEVGHPAILRFVERPLFHVNSSGDGVVFRAHCGGETTKGSNYPRCELREMKEGGLTRAEWSSGDQRLYTLTMKAAITATPAIKKHVVCAQIHDADDDLMMVRLEGTKLFVERNKMRDVMLDRDYKIGAPFEIKIQAGAGRVRLWHDGQLKMDWGVSREGCYFKAGCYTQSNPKKGDKPDSYGEVVIYDLDLHIEK